MDSGSWKAPVYFTMSAVLAFIAITTSLQSKPQTPSPAMTRLRSSSSPPLSLNASKALRQAGFTAMATLLQVSPEIFLLSSSPPSRNATTIFALQDSDISNSSLPPNLLVNLLRYHTSPLALPFEALSKKPIGTCLSTLQGGKKIAITRVDGEEEDRDPTVEINEIMISHPDIFHSESLCVHGVLGPFSPLDFEDLRQGWEAIQAPDCGSGSSLAPGNFLDPTVRILEWSSIVRRLSSEGFVAFAIGLNSVLDGIVEDYKGLESVTIFAPPSLWALASPLPLLTATVRFHVLPQRLTFQELATMPAGTQLMTLAVGIRAEVTRVASGLSVNGVDIVAPDLFSSQSFTVHGISRAFEVSDPYGKPML